MLNKRAIAHQVVVDRSQYYPMGDANIEHTTKSVYRTTNRVEYDRYNRNLPDGISFIRGLNYSFSSDGFIHVSSFTISYEHDPKHDTQVDIRATNVPFTGGFSAKRRSRMNIVLT